MSEIKMSVKRHGRKILKIMWKYNNKIDGFTIVGNREKIAEELNIFEDVWDDDVWDEIVDYCSLEWIED